MILLCALTEYCSVWGFVVVARPGQPLAIVFIRHPANIYIHTNICIYMHVLIILVSPPVLLVHGQCACMASGCRGSIGANTCSPFHQKKCDPMTLRLRKKTEARHKNHCATSQKPPTALAWRRGGQQGKVARPCFVARQGGASTDPKKDLNDQKGAALHIHPGWVVGNRNCIG